MCRIGSVVRSVLRGEVYYFVGCLESLYTLQYDMETILNRKVPLKMLIDCKSILIVVVTSSTTTENRLVIAVSAIRQAFKRGETDSVDWNKSDYNVVDGVTKLKPYAALENLLHFCTRNINTEKWIVCKNVGADGIHCDFCLQNLGNDNNNGTEKR